MQLKIKILQSWFWAFVLFITGGGGVRATSIDLIQEGAIAEKNEDKNIKARAFRILRKDV